MNAVEHLKLLPKTGDLATSKGPFHLVIVGHVDHGKSTLVGRLLADSDSLPDGKLEAIRSICKTQGKDFEYAFLLDALEEEQTRGITIDSARVFFQTDKREVILIDAPGHVEFLKNMISGAARAEAAFLIIDAAEGVQENSRRHGYLLGMLGIRQVMVAVNKMDLVDYDQEVFDEIEAEYRAFLSTCGVTPRRFIPISAREGDNIAQRSSVMSWYRGPTILEAIDRFPKEARAKDQPLRLPVQDVYRFNRQGDDRRIVAGRLEAGEVQVGDEVLFMPSGKRSTVASIETFSGPKVQALAAPHCVGLTFEEQIFIDRGELMSHVHRPPRVNHLLRANIFWMGREAMVMDRWYTLKLTTRRVEVRIAKLLNVLDASALDSALNKNAIDRHDVGEVILETRSPVAFDLTHELESTGRFVIVDGYDVAGGGIILDEAQESTDEELSKERSGWVRGDVGASERATRFGHWPALVLFTGEPNEGKALMAQALERTLFEGGATTYLLDAPEAFQPPDALGRGPNSPARLERYGEITRLFLDAGHIIISTADTFSPSDHQELRAQAGEEVTLLTIHIGEESGEGADLVLGPEIKTHEGIREIGQLLREREILLGV